MSDGFRPVRPDQISELDRSATATSSANAQPKHKRGMSARSSTASPATVTKTFEKIAADYVHDVSTTDLSMYSGWERLWRDPHMQAKRLLSEKYSPALFHGLVDKIAENRQRTWAFVSQYLGQLVHFGFGDKRLDEQGLAKLGMRSFHLRSATTPAIGTSDSASAVADEDTTASELLFHSSDSPESAARELLLHHLLTVWRLALSCPFEDVRMSCNRFLRDMQSRNIPIPQPVSVSPSRFIPLNRLAPLDDSEPLRRELLEDVFLNIGRVPNVFRVLCYFPSYTQKFKSAYNAVLRLQGPVPRTWRNYVGIMAAARHSCQALISLQQHEFLLNGGDVKWLKGLSHAPRKLQNLDNINAILAHRPWLLTKDHIMPLVKGEDSWTIPELVQVFVLMATFHSLSSLFFGCGVSAEVDLAGGVSFSVDTELRPEVRSWLEGDAEMDASSEEVLDDETKFNTSVLIDKLKMAAVGSESGEEHQPNSNVFESCEDLLEVKSDRCKGGENMSFADQLRSVSESVDAITTSDTGSQAPVIEPWSSRTSLSLPSVTSGTYAISNHPRSSERQEENLIFEDLKRFVGVGTRSFHHEDFDMRSPDYKVFRLQDYCWEDHGWSLVSQYLPGVGDLLDEEFTETRTMTDSSFSDSGQTQAAPIDTGPFRQAIWYYVLRLAGMSHDDYNYQEVNSFLNMETKKFVKKVACRPETVEQLDFNVMGFNLRVEEKCHVALLALEARKQAELLYALHAVMDVL